MRAHSLALLSAASLAALVAPAPAAAFWAVVTPKFPGPGIRGFELRETRPTIIWERGDAEPRVILTSAWQRPEPIGFSAPAGTGEGTRPEDGDFVTLEIPLTAGRFLLTVQAIARDGSLEEQTYSIEVPEWDDLQDYMARANRVWHPRAAIGPARFEFRQPGIVDQAGTDLSLEGGIARTWFDSDWELRAGGRTGLVTLSSNTGADVRFLTLDFAALYPITPSESDLRISVAGGAFYDTMLTTLAAGYHDLLGPRLYPVVRYAPSARFSVEAYARYSPVLYRSVLMFTGYREWSAGLTTSFVAHQRFAYQLGVDVSGLTLDVVAGRPVESRQLTVSLGLSW